MLEENSTVTVSEIVVYPTVIFDCFHEVKKPMIKRLKNFFEKVKMFELFTKKKPYFFHPYPIGENEHFTQEKFTIYSFTDSAESDVKEVSDFMHTFIK